MAAPYTVSPMTESLTRKQLRAGRAYLSYSLRRSTIFTVERALLRVASGWSHCICHQEAESRLEVGPEARVPRCYTFKRFHNLPSQPHQPGTKCSNTGEHRRHFPFKSQPLASRTRLPSHALIHLTPQGPTQLSRPMCSCLSLLFYMDSSDPLQLLQTSN